MPSRDIIVVGSSAGGVEALSSLVKQFSADIPAAIFVAQHVAATRRSALPQILERAGRLPVRHPFDREPFQRGRIYVAPPDHHLMLEEGIMRVVRGPKENRSRPAIDPLFRSAAYIYGRRTIGVVLSGALDDGSAGLWAIKSRGGVAIVQDPEDAFIGDMPRNAMKYVDVDYCLPIAEIGGVLTRLTAEDPEGDISMSDEERERLEYEATIPVGGVEHRSKVGRLGSPSAYTCPECHGTLFEITDGDMRRFRCRTGHAFSAESYLAELREQIENSLWEALRGLEEEESYLREIAREARRQDRDDRATEYEEQADLLPELLALLRRRLIEQVPGSLESQRDG